MSYQQGGQWGTPPPQQPTGQWGAPAPRPPKKSRKTPILIGAGAFIAVLAVIGAITGNGDADTTANAADPVTATAEPVVTEAAPAAPSATKTAPKATVPAGTVVPRFLGMGLQAAQDAAQAAGFWDLTSHDSAGRDRMQLFDRNWKVCSQKPAAGAKVSADTKLDFGTVKLEESCPSKDQKPPAKAGAVMPNFIGKGLNTATEALPSNFSITSTDVSGQDRMILLESNWQVCTQDPAVGTALNGQPVALGAVKFGESCP
jgi:beta-lactam-binding protein with PASTA domain